MPECTQAERELLDALAARLPDASCGGSYSIGDGEPWSECIVCTYDALGVGGHHEDKRLARALGNWQSEQQPGLSRVEENKAALFKRGPDKYIWGGAARVAAGSYRMPGVERDDGKGNVISEQTGEVVAKIDYEDGTVTRLTNSQTPPSASPEPPAE